MKRKPYKLVRTEFLGPVFATLGVKSHESHIPISYGTVVEDTKYRVKPDTKGKSRVLNLSRKILKCNNTKPTSKGE